MIFILHAGPDLNGAGAVVTHRLGFHLETSNYRPFRSEPQSSEKPLEGPVPPVVEPPCPKLPIRPREKERGAEREGAVR